MKILYASDSGDQKKWLGSWARTSAREVFAHPAYVSLYANETTQACAAMYESAEGTVLCPFLMRNLQKEGLCPAEFGDSPLYDLVTPYGYGGPELILAERFVRKGSTNNEEKLLKDFYRSFHQWALDNHVVSEFMRFSLFSQAHLHYYGIVEHNNDNIVCDLQLPADLLTGSFDRKVRKNIRTANKHGLQVVKDEKGKHLEAFIDIYHTTMRRRKATQFYFLGSDYFSRLLDQLPGNSTLFHVVSDSLIVASELILLSAERVYSFLGGTLESHFPARASDLLKYHILLWAREKGYRQFVIGGGYRPHDGIFSFKKSFAPGGVVPFYTGKMVFDPKTYDCLTKYHAHPTSGYFPSYRKG